MRQFHNDRSADSLISGLDSRYMISRLQPEGVNVLSLTTIATPHRGSAFADFMIEQIGRKYVFCLCEHR